VKNFIDILLAPFYAALFLVQAGTGCLSVLVGLIASVISIIMFLVVLGLILSPIILLVLAL
jgi:hypothetical protein